MGSWERSDCCTSTLPPARVAFDIVPAVSEPTPTAVPAELEGLDDTTPGLIPASRYARVTGETGGSLRAARKFGAAVDGYCLALSARPPEVYR